MEAIQPSAGERHFFLFSRDAPKLFFQMQQAEEIRFIEIGYLRN
jgi:hypothetical protein